MKPPRWRSIVIVAACVIGLGVGLILSVRPAETSLLLTGTTERITLCVTDGHTPAIRFSAAKVGSSSGSITNGRQDGYVLLANGTRIAAERFGTGPLTIALQAPTDSLSAGRLFDAADKYVAILPRTAYIYIDSLESRSANGAPFVLSLNGGAFRLEDAGTEPRAADLPQGLMRTGVITINTRSYLSRSHAIVAGTTELGPGDAFRFDTAAGSTFGVVIGDERPALTIAIRALTRRGYVARPEGPPLEVSAAPIANVMHDPVLQEYWLIVCAIIGFYRWLMPKQPMERQAGQPAQNR